MLSRQKQRYIQWFFESRDQGKTQAQLASEHGVSRNTIIRAFAWCREQRIGTRELSQQLEDRIADAREDIGRLERQIKRTEKRIDEAIPAGPKDSPMVGLTQAVGKLYSELREQKKYLAELEGVYKTTVNVNVGGQEGNTLKLKLTSDSDGGT